MENGWRRIGAAAVVAAVAIGCSERPQSAPIAGPSFDVTDPTPGIVTACKDASAPAGTYDFTVSQEGGRGGTLPVGSSFSLAPGECADVWEALPDPPNPDTPAVQVTVAELSPPTGVVFDSLVGTSGAEGPFYTTDPTWTVRVNYNHGAVYNFFNSGFELALGRMTGGGGQITVGDIQVTKGLTIHCDITLSNNVEVNWPDNKWHLTKPITSAECVDDPAIDPTPPAAPFDTFIGEGVGELNGMEGSIIRFIFVDSGEPGGKNDLAQIQIWAPGADPDVDTPVLNVPLSYIDHGNLQAHYDQPHGNKP